ncbi:MAG: phosphotransferase [candidate division Zixibacteria bacterium]|nr:phosphotransferase [candidate division Zixibacteria bacterium]
MNADEQFEHLLTQTGPCLDLTRGVCTRHALSPELTRIVGGSRLMYATGDGRIIKIFPPHEVDFFQTEVLFLNQLHDRLPLPTPRLYAADRFDEYPYVIMECLSGVPLTEAWAVLTDQERKSIVRQLGIAVRAMHDLPVDLFAAAPFRWHPIIDAQRESLLDRHQNWGLDSAWSSQIPGYIGGTVLNVHDHVHLVPLHTELMQEHVFIEKRGGDWTISGLIDYEPSMIGHREYEFCAVGLFITCGNRDLFRLFLSSYGYADAELTPLLSRQVMMLLLLHRYGNLRRFLGLIPTDLRLTTLSQLEQYWYGL